ncbi:MAG: hypothetical protein D6767_05910 [Candidatus Hydrogenedentota bacterium]|nr:MAG: hypothetical protein D6767_05910 [Candidatus Hydrogenedentota bacterium]
MSLLFSILLIVSFVLILLAMVNPFAYLSLVLQALFAAGAYYSYRKKKEKGKNTFMAFVLSALHSLNLLIVIVFFFFIALPSAEKGDLQNVAEGISKLVRTKLGLPMPSFKEESKTSSEKRETGVPEVEDPPELQ